MKKKVLLILLVCTIVLVAGAGISAETELEAQEKLQRAIQEHWEQILRSQDNVKEIYPSLSEEEDTISAGYAPAVNPVYAPPGKPVEPNTNKLEQVPDNSKNTAGNEQQNRGTLVVNSDYNCYSFFPYYRNYAIKPAPYDEATLTYILAAGYPYYFNYYYPDDSAICYYYSYLYPYLYLGYEYPLYLSPGCYWWY